MFRMFSEAKKKKKPKTGLSTATPPKIHNRARLAPASMHKIRPSLTGFQEPHFCTHARENVMVE
jgi:hypothetical protein